MNILKREKLKSILYALSAVLIAIIVLFILPAASCTLLYLLIEPKETLWFVLYTGIICSVTTAIIIFIFGGD